MVLYGGTARTNVSGLRILETSPEPRVFDFRNLDYERTPMAVPAKIGPDGKALATNRRRLRHRVREASKKGSRRKADREFKQLYKPIEEWDAEELARGRPRNRDGNFGGKPPKWISRELHEEAITRFRQAVRDEMNSSTHTALQVIDMILSDDERDSKGRPRTAPSTKLDAAKFLVEHVLGKPKQHVETDISVKMQGMLATAVITPGLLPALPGSAELTSPRTPADLDVESWEDDD